MSKRAMKTTHLFEQCTHCLDVKSMGESDAMQVRYAPVNFFFQLLAKIQMDPRQV